MSSCSKAINCPTCGTQITIYKNPVPTVDTIIYDTNLGIVLIERRFEPLGWALPGGFVEYGETLAEASVRETKEETNLDIELQALIGVYSNPSRDPRQHTITTAFWAKTKDPSCLQGGDDAAHAQFFKLDCLPKEIVFEHNIIIQDFLNILTGKAYAAWR